MQVRPIQQTIQYLANCKVISVNMGVFFTWPGSPSQLDGLQALFEIASTKPATCVCVGEQPVQASVMPRSFCCVKWSFSINLLFSLFTFSKGARQDQCVCVCFVWQTIFVGLIGRASMRMAGLRENIPNCNFG